MIKYKKETISNLEELIESYADGEFSSPFRSTIPLIELVFYNEQALEKLIPNFKDYDCVFEYETPVGKGRGKASCTDLMIFNKSKAFCIEAKRTEPAYQTVADWANVGNNLENRSLVLFGWLKMIDKRCGTKLVFKDVETLPYQMIHRFASACMISDNSEMLYFCFDLYGDAYSYYERNLEKLASLTGKKVPIKLIVFNLKSDSFKILENRWESNHGKLDLSDDVQRAMLEGKIMDITIKDIKQF